MHFINSLISLLELRIVKVELRPRATSEPTDLQIKLNCPLLGLINFFLIKYFLEKSSNKSFVRMTGSGAAIVAYFKSKKLCDYVKKKFSRKYKNCWCKVAKTI